MTARLIHVDEKSKIPLFGIDFFGIIDRGTNVIEIKPITTCNLKCKYCFVSAGGYLNNFIVDPDYLIKKIKELIIFKGRKDIEIHIAPYGEALLYPNLFGLIKKIWEIKGVEIISMQSNGLLLDQEKIEKFDAVCLTRINISINTFKREKANFLCNCKDYDMEKLLNSIQALLKSKINVLIAPVWFPKENDDDIEEIIKFVVNLREEGYSKKKIQIGIQKYLTYKTGRKLKKIRPKTWGFFYKQLSSLEKKYEIKLKLGPKDFGIHKRNCFRFKDLKKNDILKLRVISEGRWKRECIGKLNDNLGIKVLLKKPLIFSNAMMGKEIKAQVIKANYRDNIVTAVMT